MKEPPIHCIVCNDIGFACEPYLCPRCRARAHGIIWELQEKLREYEKQLGDASKIARGIKARDKNGGRLGVWLNLPPMASIGAIFTRDGPMC